MTRTQRRAAFVALAAVLVSLVGVPGAAAAPRDRVLTGRVVGNGGEALAGASVVLDEGQGFFGGFFDALGCVLSWGTDDDLCGVHSVTTTTDRAGRYRLVLPHGSPVADAGIRYVHVTAAGARPARFDGSLAVSTRTTRLADVVLWTRTARFARSGGRIVVTATPPRGAGGPPRLNLHGDDLGPFAVAWNLPFDKNGRADVDERVFEDGVRDLQGPAFGSWYGRRAGWVSAATPVPHVGRPTSRARGCSTYQDGGALVAVPRCPFTDGHLATALGLHRALALQRQVTMCTSASRCATPNALVLDLGELRLPRAVVMRACDCDVELSPDGRLWTPWQQEHREGEYFSVLTGLPQPTRYVRVRGTVFMTWHLQEVSVWSDPLLPAPLSHLPAAPTVTTTPAAPEAGPADAPALVRFVRRLFP